MRITRAKRKPPAFCREVRTGFCGLFGKITAFSAKMILKRTVLWYTFCAKSLILVDRIVTLRCRSPCGERGLKYPPGAGGDAAQGRRSPCRERGLKYRFACRRNVRRRRSPCGERGLKFSVVMMKMGRMRRIFPVASAAPSCGKRLHRHAFVTRNGPNFPAPPWFSPSSDIANSAIRAPTHVCRAGLNGSPKRRQSP